MTVIRWAPFQEIEGLHRDLNRFFDTLVPTHKQVFDDLAFIPAAELTEMPEALILKLELPGIDPKTLDIQVSAKSVTISGDRKTQTDSSDPSITRSEFRYGRFHRIVPLSTKVVNDQTQADYTDGILTLTLIKAAADQQKTFKVEVQ